MEAKNLECIKRMEKEVGNVKAFFNRYDDQYLKKNK